MSDTRSAQRSGANSLSSLRRLTTPACAWLLTMFPGAVGASTDQGTSFVISEPQPPSFVTPSQSTTPDSVSGFLAAGDDKRTPEALVSTLAWGVVDGEADLRIVPGGREGPQSDPLAVGDSRSGSVPEVGDHRWVPGKLVTMLAWGSGDGEVGFRTVPGGGESPQSLAVDEESDTLYVLDTANQRVLALSLAGEFRTAFPIGFNAVDLQRDRKGRLYLLSSARTKVAILNPDSGTTRRFDIAATEPRPARLAVDSTGRVLGEAVDGLLHPLALVASGAPGTAQSMAGATESVEQPLVLRQSAKHGVVVLPNGEEIDVFPDLGTLDSLKYLGKDGEGDVVVLLDQHSEGQMASRYLHWYQGDELIATARVPTSSFAYTTRDLVVAESGDVYQLLPAMSGLRILRWDLEDATFSEVGQQSEKGAAATQSRSQGTTETEELSTALQSAPVSQVVSTANAYLNHYFYVSSQSITSGSVETIGCSPYYKTVQTPTHITSPGWYVGVPYKWGGSSGLAGVSPGGDGCTYGFVDAGLQAGRFAGDINTSTDCGSCSAVGVDCSGFVAQCWGLADHPFGTRNFDGYPNAWACPLHSIADDLMQGDIVVSTNPSQQHMRLFDYVNGSGYRVFWESALSTEKVARNSYGVATLQSLEYRPYRYKLIEGIFNVGDRVRAATSGLNVRPCAGLSCTPPLGSEALGSEGTVIAGPETSDGYLWWDVDWDDGKEGWSVQCYFGPGSASVSHVTLTLNSELFSGTPLSGVSATITPLDNNGAGSGSTPLTRTYNSNTTVDITVPATLSGGQTFLAWAKDGNEDGYYNTTYQALLDTSHTITAIYEPPATCTSFSISPTSVSPSSAAGSQLVAITGSPSGCQGGSWSASGNGSWITVSPSSGSGSGSTTVYWTQNTSTSSRSGSASVAGNSFAVTQAGSSTSQCTDDVLSYSTLNSTETIRACHDLVVGPSVSIIYPGNVTLRAGNAVVIGNGFSVGAGATLVVQGAPCTSCVHYTGELSGTGDYQYQPDGTWYYSASSGHQEGWLEGPSGADFDLYLWQWDGSSWVVVGASISFTASEHVDFDGAAGYYLWEIDSYSGSGTYDFWLKHP